MRGGRTPTPVTSVAGLVFSAKHGYWATNSASANMLTGTVTSGLNAFAFIDDLLQRSCW